MVQRVVCFVALINLQRELLFDTISRWRKWGWNTLSLVPFRTVKNCTRKEYLSRVKSLTCLFLLLKKYFFFISFIAFLFVFSFLWNLLIRIISWNWTINRKILLNQKIRDEMNWNRLAGIISGTCIIFKM